MQDSRETEPLVVGNESAAQSRVSVHFCCCGIWLCKPVLTGQYSAEQWVVVTTGMLPIAFSVFWVQQ